MDHYEAKHTCNPQGAGKHEQSMTIQLGALLESMLLLQHISPLPLCNTHASTDQHTIHWGTKL